MSWYLRMLQEVFLPLENNCSAYFQKYNWDKNNFDDWEEVKPSDFIIIEGVSSCRVEFRRFISFGIYLELEREKRLERGLIRDGGEAMEQWFEWMKEEDEYLSAHRPDEFVNLIIRGDYINEIDHYEFSLN